MTFGLAGQSSNTGMNLATPISLPFHQRTDLDHIGTRGMDAKNEKKSQTLKNIETATENENGCITKPINLVRYDSIGLRFWNLVLMHSVSWLKLRKINCQLSPSRSVKQGSLDLLLMRRRIQPIASKILMKTFFATRMARPDFLRATQSLASQVTKWLCTDM